MKKTFKEFLWSIKKEENLYGDFARDACSDPDFGNFKTDKEMTNYLGSRGGSWASVRAALLCWDRYLRDRNKKGP